MGRRHGRARRAAEAPAVALLALALSGCSVERPGSVLAPAGPAARMELDLLGLSLVVVGAISAAVLLVLLYIVVRFRARPGDASEGADNPGVTWLEVAWTAVPAGLLVLLAVPSLTDTFYLAKPVAGGMRVTVVGHQYWWEYRYDDLGLVTANELHVPAARPLDLRVTSADVMHEFWVPRLGGKVDAAPGRRNFLYLQSDGPGVFAGECTQLCGASHAHMLTAVYADTPSAFEAWRAELTKPFSPPPPGSAAARGMQIFAAKCASCHAIRGTAFKGATGPDLTALMLRKTIGAGTLELNRENLVRWVTDASVFKPGVLMPSGKGKLALTDAQIRDVVAFLETLR